MMNSVVDKSSCCGCAACAQRCPQRCISMLEDCHGFLYPKINSLECVDCGLCKKVCPMLNTVEPKFPITVYAAWHKDEIIRQASSSGGVFSAIADYIINNGGVVFGAKFNKRWEVVHGYTEDIEGVAAFRGSKYVQSVVGDNFVKAEEFLKQGRHVLFTGTPCQISGLKHFLQKNYDNLIAVEVACHGVPSPRVWREYLGNIHYSEINFRDKSTGWKDYSVKIGKKRKRHEYDDYMNCFLANYSMRPSCFNCPVKCGKSMADITIADLWGISKIDPKMDDDKGTSAIIIWREREFLAINHLAIETEKVDFDGVVKHNPAIVESSHKPIQYIDFWEAFVLKPQQTIKSFASFMRPSLLIRIKTLFYRILHL